MSALNQMHVNNKAILESYNGKAVPASYNSTDVMYKAVRENILLVDHSHMSIVSVIGEDAWSLLNYFASADISIIRDEQGVYTLILNEDGSIWGDAYVLCTDEGYYLLSESLSENDIIERLNWILTHHPELDIQEVPEIRSMESDEWGALLLEGPYAWELLAEIYGFDVIGLPYHEYMTADDGIITFRCGKHGEFAYLMVGSQQTLVELWQQLVAKGERYNLKTGGLDYQHSVRIENTCWDASIYQNYTRNPIELQMQWAIQYDKDDFIGKAAVEAYSNSGAKRKLIGIKPLEDNPNILPDDPVLVEGKQVGKIIKCDYSFGCQSHVALALIDAEYAYSDLAGFDIKTHQGSIASATHNLPFLYNFSLFVNPTEHSFIDALKPKSAL